jgi:hypothetical protein
LTGLNGSVDESFEITYTPAENSSLSDSENATFQSGESYNLTGTLFTNWEPSSTNGSFERGTTYNTSNADSPVWVIYQANDSTTEIAELNGEFTIDTLTDVSTGEEVNSTTLEENNRGSYNATLDQARMEWLINYHDNITNDDGGGGSTVTTQQSSFPMEIVYLVVAIVALLVAAKAVQ